MLIVLQYLWVGLIASGAIVVLASWIRRPRGEKRLCPKRVKSLLGLVIPWRWVWPHRCGFDLTGRDEDELCPECGRSTATRKRLRGRPGFRPLVLGLTVIAGGLGLQTSLRARHGGLAWAMPSLVLVTLEGPNSPLGRIERKPYEDKLERRVRNHELNGYTADVLSQQLVKDLVTDQEHYNAERAIGLLRAMWPDSRDAIEETLGHDNWQAKCLASSLLRTLTPKNPSAALIEVTVQELGDDKGEPGRYLRFHNAADATFFLIKHAQVASDKVGEALSSADMQQRVLAAIVIAEAGLEEHAEPAATVLLEHLGHNAFTGDASLAARGLYSLGERALPQLDDTQSDEDPQRRAWAMAIAEHLRGRPWGELEPGLEQHRLTSRTRDPIRQNLSRLIGEFN